MSAVGWGAHECTPRCGNPLKVKGEDGVQRQAIQRRENVEVATQGEASGLEGGVKIQCLLHPTSHSTLYELSGWGDMETTAEGVTSTLSVGSPTQATRASVDSFPSVLHPRWRHLPGPGQSGRGQPCQLSGIHRQFPGLLLRTGSLNTYFSVTSLTVTFGGQRGGV